MGSGDLARWAEQNLRGVRSAKDGWLNAYCPIHEREGESKSQSFGFNPETGGWHCHGACQESGNIWELAKRLKLPTPPDRPGFERKQKSDDDVIAEYPYRDEQGQLLGTKVRYRTAPGEDKKIKWRPKGPERHVLFRLPELLSKPGELTLYVEGEKDVLAASKLGFLATTAGSASSFGKVKREDRQVLAGRHVVIIPDNDAPGWDLAEKVAGALAKLEPAATVQIVDLAREWDASGGADLSDWVERAGGTADQLRAMIASGRNDVRPNALNSAEQPKLFELEQPERDPAKPWTFPRTDLGNAELLAAVHGQDIRYNHEAKVWFFWDGRRWQRDREGRVPSLANAIARLRFQRSRGRKAEVVWALKSESLGHRNSCLGQAACLPGLAVKYEDFDLPPWTLNVLNGQLDLVAGELGPHRREDYLTHLVAVPYDQAAECPRFLKFLAEILPDEEVRRFLRRAIGYCLTAKTREQCFFIMWGSGNNGKSVLLELLLYLLGSYAVAIKSETIMQKRIDPQIRNDLAKLRGIRFAKTVETSEGRRLDEGLVKQLTGEDRIVARFLFQEEFEFPPTFKLWLATNNKPEIRGTDFGIWRRIYLIPFTVTIPPDQVNRALLDELKEELPGILVWAVEGCREWQADGLQPPAAVRAATDDYRAEQDVLGQFLASSCVVKADARTEATPLFEAFKAWCLNTCEHPWSQRRFGIQMGARGFKRGFVHGGRTAYSGIGLLVSDEVSPESKGEQSSEGSLTEQEAREYGLWEHMVTHGEA